MKKVRRIELIRKRNILIPVIILTAMSFFYPLTFVKIFAVVPMASYIKLFTPATMTLLCLSPIFLLPHKTLNAFLRNPCLVILLLIISIINFYYFLTVENYSFDFLCAAFIWFALPAVAYINYKGFLRVLPIYMSAFWLLNTAHMIIDLIFHNNFYTFSGLPGNINWNASFIIISCIFTVFFIHRITNGIKNKPSRYFILASPVLISFFLFLNCDSRGAGVALLFGGIIFFYLNRGYKRKRAFVYTLLAVSFMLTIIFYFYGTDKFARLISEDVRLPLWKGAASLIMQNAALGTGPGLFESEFAPLVPLEYFSRKVVAVRKNHPHNHFLFIAANYGVLFFFIWGFFVIYPLSVISAGYRRIKNTEVRIIFFSLLILLIHSMVDLILYRWPTNCLALIFIGIIWGWISKNKYKKTFTPALLPSVLMKIAGIILLFPLTSMLITEFKSSGYERSAVVYSKKHPELAAVLFDKAVESKHDRPGVIYKAAVHFYYEMDNPELALKYFSMISENTPFKNYAHNNGFTGIILFEKGRYGEALKYFRRETENYPVSAVARYYIYLCFLKMNMKKEAELTFSHLLAILKHKGLTFKDMPELMKNPVYDSKPFLLIEAKKKGKPENDRKTH